MTTSLSTVSTESPHPDAGRLKVRRNIVNRVQLGWNVSMVDFYGDEVLVAGNLTKDEAQTFVARRDARAGHEKHLLPHRNTAVHEIQFLPIVHVKVGNHGEVVTVDLDWSSAAVGEWDAAGPGGGRHVEDTPATAIACRAIEGSIDAINKAVTQVFLPAAEGHDGHDIDEIVTNVHRRVLAAPSIPAALHPGATEAMVRDVAPQLAPGLVAAVAQRVREAVTPIPAAEDD